MIWLGNYKQFKQVNFQSIEVFEYVNCLGACQESNPQPVSYVSLSVSINHEADILIRYLYKSTYCSNSHTFFLILFSATIPDLVTRVRQSRQWTKNEVLNWI